MSIDPDFDAAVAAAGLTLHRLPLSWYVDKLQRGEHFTLARYGDGELACMLGSDGANTDGCEYGEQLGDDLRYSLGHQEPDYIYGMQRVLPEDVAKYRGVRPPDRDWVDSEVFGRALLAGELYPLVDQLRRMPTTFVGSIPRSDMRELLGCRRVVETPRSNTYAVKDDIIRELIDMNHKGVYLFSCGMAAKVIVSELHGRIKGWLLDMGHLWDVFVGRISREELKTVTPETIKRNLGCW